VGESADICKYDQSEASFLRMVHHEAGHAFVARLVGIETERLFVVQWDDSTKLAHDGHPDRNSRVEYNSRQHAKASCAGRCLVSRAGEVAERIHCGLTSPLPDACWISDIEEITKCVSNASAFNFSQDQIRGYLGLLSARVEEWLGVQGDGFEGFIGDLLALRQSNEPHGSRLEVQAGDLNVLLAKTNPLPPEAVSVPGPPHPTTR